MSAILTGKVEVNECYFEVNECNSDRKGRGQLVQF